MMASGNDNRKDLPRTDRGLTVIARHETFEQVCILENASRSGAGLRINPDFHLPKKFTLILVNMALPVTLKWRHRDRAGVRFAFTENDRPLAHRLLTGLRPLAPAAPSPGGRTPAGDDAPVGDAPFGQL